MTTVKLEIAQIICAMKMMIMMMMVMMATVDITITRNNFLQTTATTLAPPADTAVSGYKNNQTGKYSLFSFFVNAF